MAIVVFGAIAGFFGLTIGIDQACRGPSAGNLCALWGVFIAGPVFAALVILLVAVGVSWIRPGREN